MKAQYGLRLINKRQHCFYYEGFCDNAVAGV